MEKEKALIKLGEEHQKLVKDLIDALKLGQFGFLHAGRFLFKIHEKKTYLTEDSTREITFTEFCTRPDLPLPGRTEASRLRIAQRLIRIYQFFILEKGYTEKRLALVGYSKLDLLVPVIKAKTDEADDWLDKAALLTASDLISEVRLKDKSLADILECIHKSTTKVLYFRCDDCSTIWKKDPNKKTNVQTK